MTIRIHAPDQLAWRRIGDIPMGWMRDHIDPTELEGHLAFHEAGDDGPQLMEMRLDPQTLVAPHSHDDPEIFYVVEGSLHWGEQVLGAGGSMFIPAGNPYSFRAGERGARLLNVRSRADHSFVPVEQKAQVLDQFSRQAEGYGRLTGAMAAVDRSAAFRAQVGLAPDDVVLDVCCGTGAMALSLAPHAAQVTGLDLTPAMLEQARGAQDRSGCDNVDWVEGDAFALPFADASFSLVVCGAAFHHMLDPRPALSEMVRVCRVGGRVAVRDVTPAPEKSAAYDSMERMRDPSHVHALTPGEMAHLGTGLQLDPPMLHASVAADLPLDAVLATSFPTTCTVGDIRALFRADAEAGEDKLGFDARVMDGEVRVSYPQTTAVWVRRA
jgi:ubiquinone/menaquinone biosynthesis C-methylase UbiE/quercetin dioxygenase-like cupin family protein